MTYLNIYLIIYVLSIPMALIAYNDIIEESDETNIGKDLMHYVSKIIAFIPILNTLVSVLHLFRIILEWLDNLIAEKKGRELNRAAREKLKELRDTTDNKELKEELTELLNKTKDT